MLVCFKQTFIKHLAFKEITEKYPQWIFSGMPLVELFRTVRHGNSNRSGNLENLGEFLKTRLRTVYLVILGGFLCVSRDAYLDIWKLLRDDVTGMSQEIQGFRVFTKTQCYVPF
jgi:hypothetical protein